MSTFEYGPDSGGRTKVSISLIFSLNWLNKKNVYCLIVVGLPVVEMFTNVVTYCVTLAKKVKVC